MTRAPEHVLKLLRFRPAHRCSPEARVILLLVGNKADLTGRMTSPRSSSARDLNRKGSTCDTT